LKSDKIIKHLVAGFTGLVAFVTYFITVAPTVSFWDCGEFIAAANILGIPHPPGTPFFVMLARAFIVALPMVEEIAKRVNYISVISSAATVYVTALFAWDFLAKVLSKDALAAKISSKARTLVLSTTALVAGFLLAFSDTFWFNAVEAEVYGFAMLILMLVSYFGLVWLNHRNSPQGDRILVFICYIAFLGVGSHLYTMLTIPAVFVLLLIAEPKKIMSRFPVWITGVLLCSVIYYVSGFLILGLGCIAVLAVLMFAKPFNADVMKSIRLSLAFAIVALVGYSSHLYIPIRSELNPAIDENDPEINIRDDEGNLQLKNLFVEENWKAFNDFIGRKQYGSESMISRAFYRRGQIAHQFMSFPHMGFGGYQIAQYLPYKVGGVTFLANGAYAFDAYENVPTERLGIQFPTQMAMMGDSILAQLAWFILFNGTLIFVCVLVTRRSRTLGIYLSVLYGLCSLGLIFYINFADGTRMENREREYWVNAMTRNISDLRNAGITGLTVPDPNALIQANHEIENAKFELERHYYAKSPESVFRAAEQKVRKAEENPVWQNWKKIEAAYARMGQVPPFPQPVHLEVRERDYFYTPGYIFMSMILGIGAGFLVLLLALNSSVLMIPVAALLMLVSFFVPFASNFEDHDRSGLWVPWDYAYNILQSCRPNAILFTNGDNDTFPLWFAQEVAGIRKDVRVVNLSLGNTDWYIKQMLTQEPVLELSYDKAGIERDMVIQDGSDQNPNHLVSTWVTKAKNAMPILERLAANPELDSAKSLKYKVMLQVYTAFLEWQERTRSVMMMTQSKLVLDLAMNNLDRPIHFSTTVGVSNFMGLEKYSIQEGMIYNFMKGDFKDRRNEFDLARTAYLLDDVFQFRGLGDGTAYINAETERLLSGYISLYLQIAFTLREQIVELRKQPYTADVKRQVEEKTVFAVHFLELGMKQFPLEWRNYWAAAFIYEAAGEKARAMEAVERGLKSVPDYDTQGKGRLMAMVQPISALPDSLPVVESGAPADSLSSSGNL
jgi:hypothetical protein